MHWVFSKIDLHRFSLACNKSEVILQDRRKAKAPNFCLEYNAKNNRIDMQHTDPILCNALAHHHVFLPISKMYTPHTEATTIRLFSQPSFSLTKY